MYPPDHLTIALDSGADSPGVFSGDSQRIEAGQVHWSDRGRVDDIVCRPIVMGGAEFAERGPFSRAERETSRSIAGDCPSGMVNTSRSTNFA